MAQHAPHLPMNPATTLQQLVEGQPDFIEITTPATAGTELAIQHGLGRVPKGFEVVKRPFIANPAIGEGLFQAGVGDTTWTKEFLYLKFSRTSVNVTISVH